MSRPRIAIVGAGFAGYRTARAPSRSTRRQAGIARPDAAGRFLHPLPRNAAGTREPRRITPSPPGAPPRVRPGPGGAGRTGPGGCAAHHTGPGSDDGTLRHGRPVLAPGSADGPPPVPRAAGHAHGFRGPPKALYPRDHATRRTEPAAAGDDPAPGPVERSDALRKETHEHR
ncbi:hypothetical protein SUDANB58_04947 [Streptomyces sp. enrichment culture]|uniref:hypothetical protein n=1 Tax=Streptomyces sp. enrichment culture TaxID=1795815 RepID=UPI003F566868